MNDGTSTPRPRRGSGRPKSTADAVGREGLIAETCRQLQNLPPEKVTRTGVARSLRVNPSLIKYYFRTRETMLIAAAERVVDEFESILRDKRSKAPDSAEGHLWARVASHLEMQLTYPFFHRLITEHVFGSDSPEAKELFRKAHEKSFAAYRAIIDAGIAEGVMEEMDPKLLQVAVTGMCEFYVTAGPVLSFGADEEFNCRHRSHEYLEFITNMILRGILKRESRNKPGSARKPKRS